MKTARTEPHPRVKICHVVLLPELDGAQRCMLEIVCRLDPSKYDRHVICSGEGRLTQELECQGIPYHLVASMVRPVRLVSDWKALGHLQRLMQEHAFDIVHTHSSKSGFLGRIAARRAGVDLIVHQVQGFAFHEYSNPVERRLFLALERFAGKSTDLLVFVNREERELAIREAILPEERCTTVFNGVDLNLLAPENNRDHRIRLRREFGAVDDEVLILVSGRLDTQKQPLILPRIAAEIEQLRPAIKWRILVAGTGPLEHKLRCRISDLGLEHRIHLVGWYPEPHELTGAVDLALLPSLWEGLPLVLLEAQAAGLPIVASSVKGNREVVTGRTGFLCDPQQPLSYANAVVNLLDDERLRHELGNAGRRRAEEHFSLENTIRSIDDLYSEHLGR